MSLLIVMVAMDVDVEDEKQELTSPQLVCIQDTSLATATSLIIISL